MKKMNKTCSKCGEVKPISEMRKNRNQCKACVAEYWKQYRQDPVIKERQKQYDKQYGKQWRQDNKEHRKQYRQDNKEHIKQYNKQYYQDNKEHIKQRDKQYRQDPVNKERRKQYDKQYRQDNKERIYQRHKQYYQDNKERIKQYYQDPVNKEHKKQYNKQYNQDNKERIYQRHKQYLKQYRQNLPAATYLIMNTINGKVYIGQSTQYSRRWAEHKRNLRKNTHPNKHLQQDWNEHGEDAFVFEVIEELPPDTSSELLLEKEREQIIEHLKRDVILYNTLN